MLATSAAPLALTASMTADMKPNVEKTRPGWRGEQYGM